MEAMERNLTLDDTVNSGSGSDATDNQWVTFEFGGLLLGLWQDPSIREFVRRQRYYLD